MRDEIGGLLDAFEAFEPLGMRMEDGWRVGADEKVALVDWPSLPPGVDPLGTNKKGGEARGRRKRNQVATFVAHLRDVIEAFDVNAVVDYGCGTGNTVLTLASLFPDIRFTGVDLNEMSIRILNERIVASGLNNVTARVGLIEECEDLNVDVALALHVCGEATDFVMNQAIEKRIPFIVAPCCVGKVQEGGMRSLNRMRNDLIQLEKPTIERPRSKLMRAAGFDFNSYMSAATLADWSGHQGVDPSNPDEPLAALPRRAKSAIEADRGEFARQQSYRVSLHKMPAQSGIRDDVIVGIPHP